MLNETFKSRVPVLLTAALAIVLIAFPGTAAAAGGFGGHKPTQRKAQAKHSSHGTTAGRHGSWAPTHKPGHGGSHHGSTGGSGGQGGSGGGSTPTETPTTPPTETPITTPTPKPPVGIPSEPETPPAEETSPPPVEEAPAETPPAKEEAPAKEEEKALSTQPSCPIGTGAEEAIPMTMPGCRVVASDTGAETSPTKFWGRLQCMSASDYLWGTSGGDPHQTAFGTSQGNEDFRQMTTFDGDEFWGERCELGEDDWRTGPTALYREGDHYVTYISERLPSNFPLNTKMWQTVMQMKQTEPSNVGGGAPQIEMEAREGRWVIDDDWHELWSFPAKANSWTRFAWNVNYSKDANKGTLQVSADLNGNGSFDDPGERSPTFHVATLKTEIYEPGGTGEGLIPPGSGVPAHLRAGIYHNPEIPCPVSGGGCSVQVDNVQVMAAP